MKSNILIVDDSALLRRVECDIINSDNKLQATDTCKDGLEALEKLRTQKYDAVILDINMPRMNGLEVLSHLQKESIKTPVVVVSTLTIEGADEAIKSLELGAFDFVTKPNNIIEAKGTSLRKLCSGLCMQPLESHLLIVLHAISQLLRRKPVLL